MKVFYECLDFDCCHLFKALRCSFHVFFYTSYNNARIVTQPLQLPLRQSVLSSNKSNHELAE